MHIIQRNARYALLFVHSDMCARVHCKQHLRKARIFLPSILFNIEPTWLLENLNIGPIAIQEYLSHIAIRIVKLLSLFKIHD